jgi:hypothetical protein
MSEIKNIKWTRISVNPSIRHVTPQLWRAQFSKEFALSNFMLFQTASQDVRAPSQRPSKRIAPSQGLAGLLSASVFAAVLAVADQVIDSWSDGHMLLAWVMLWLSIFGGLALLTRPMRRASTASGKKCSNQIQPRPRRTITPQQIRNKGFSIWVFAPCTRLCYNSAPHQFL